MATSEQELIKIIETKQTFADLAYKEYRSSQYGMTFCCPTNFNNHTNINEICNWEASSVNSHTISKWTFTSFNLSDYITNGGTVGSWVQTEETTYSRRIFQRPDVITGTAASNGATDYPVIMLSAGGMDSLVTSLSLDANSRIFAFVMRDVDGLPEIANADWLRIMQTQGADGNDPMQISTTDPQGSLLDGAGRRQQPYQYDKWYKFRWLECTGGGVSTTGVNPVVTVRQNDAPAGMPKNGANVGDYIWLMISIDGTYNYYQADGSLNWYMPSETGSAAASRFNYGYNNNASVAVDACDFRPAAGGAPGFYVVWGVSGNGGTLQYGRTAAELRESVKYANRSIENNKLVDATYSVCNDDAELLYITVTDINSAPVKDYDVIIDNTHYGKTDAAGVLIVNLKNASTDTKHMINGCKCFTTTGACNQQKIDIVLEDAIKPVCTNLAIDCL